MKKFISVLVLLLCVGFIFAGSLKPYLLTLDLHPAILQGFCPTYIGAGLDYSISLNNGDTVHANMSLAGGLYERGFYQNPKTGMYSIENNDPVQLTDIYNFEWNFKGIYNLGEFFTFSAGYNGIFEQRNESMLYTGKYWPKNENTDRWLGGSTKEKMETTIKQWLSILDSDSGTAVYPELSTNNSVFNIVYAEAEYNRMLDTMVANEGYLALLKLRYAPGFFNKQANFFYANIDFVAAKTLLDKRFANGKNMFAISIIDRVDLNFTKGSMVPAYFQESISLGRRIRGFDTVSYASEISAVNNFEIRFSGPEFTKGIFFRTDLFFDCGIGVGNKFNTSIPTKNILASVGIQEMIDYMDAFDLGIEVSYLLKGQRMSDPTHPLQIGATFFLDF